MARKKKSNGQADRPTTTAQMLGSLIKSARDIMRKDKGLNGDLDRLPLLTWIMFLKFLDDLERQREDEASLARKKFRAAIEPPPARLQERAPRGHPTSSSWLPCSCRPRRAR